MPEAQQNTTAAVPEKVSKAFGAARGDKMDLFVYGTLMNDHYVRLLLNRKVEAVPAKLNHYMKVTPPWSFPFIVKHYSSVTFGRILKKLTKGEMRVLDEFENEGVLYKRQIVVVRTKEGRQRCMTYVGNISALQHSFGKEVNFEDRFSLFIQKKIDALLKDTPLDTHERTTRVMRELSSSAVEEIILSHFDGNYICSYIMIEALKDAKPPDLAKVLSNKDVLPYAGNYMRLACQHIIFNQFVEKVRNEFPDAVRLSQQYFRHGLAMLLSLIFYNRHKADIDAQMALHRLDAIAEGRTYWEYAEIAVGISDTIFDTREMEDIIAYVDANWYSTPTPLGAELEFSYLGKRAIEALPGEDKVYDSFYWFRDFDMFHRAWRFGGHVDSHHEILASQKRHRGFFEYALGRYNIVGDLSRPLFDCPWGMSELINEAVNFLDIPPHSLHISMELPKTRKSLITDSPHEESDLACLVMLGGDVRAGEDGKLRAFRIYGGELDTNAMKSLNFSDRKYHFSKIQHDKGSGADVMEYKFMRLRRERTDYEALIIALKGYQFATKGRPIKSSGDKKEMPEQIFLREWAAAPSPVPDSCIKKFISKIESGILTENNMRKIDQRKQKILGRISQKLYAMNEYISKNIQHPTSNIELDGCNR